MPITTEVVSSNSDRIEMYSIQHYVITFADGWFSPGTLVSATNNTCRHDIPEICLKIEINIITRKWYIKEHILCDLGKVYFIHQWIYYPFGILNLKMRNCCKTHSTKREKYQINTTYIKSFRQNVIVHLKIENISVVFMHKQNISKIIFIEYTLKLFLLFIFQMRLLHQNLLCSINHK